MIQRLTDAEIGERLAGMTLEEIQAHARFSPEACNRIIETLFKAVVAARAGTERDAVWNAAVNECIKLALSDAGAYAELRRLASKSGDRNDASMHSQSESACRQLVINLKALLRSLPTEKIENRPDGLGGEG